MTETSQLLIFPTAGYTLEDIASALKTLPDSIWAITDEKSIKIKTIRRLQTELSTASASKQTRQIVIYPAERITEQAQQALLKIIEEPPQNTQITLVTASVSQVLPTIQSRCVTKIVNPKLFTTETTEKDSIYQQLAACQSWKDVVTLSQQLPSKKHELIDALQQEYAQMFTHTEESVLFLETLSEVIVALNHNVQPTLCVEHLLFHTYEKSR